MLNVIKVSVPIPGELGPLSDRLREVPGLEVTRTPGEPAPGEQGAIDLLTVAGSSTALLAAVRTIPAYLRARRSGMSVKTTIKGREFILTLDNVDNVMPIIERLIQDD